MTESDKNEEEHNPLNDLGVKSIDDYDGKLSIGEYLDMIFKTDEGKELQEKKSVFTQLEFQLELLKIMEKYPRDTI